MEKVLIHQRVTKRAKNTAGSQALGRDAEETAGVPPGTEEFLEYAVGEHRQPQAFLVPEKDYLKIGR